MGTRLYRVEKIVYANECTIGYGDGTDKLWELMEEQANYQNEHEFEISVELLENIINCNMTNLIELMKEEERDEVVKIIKEVPDYAIANIRNDIEIEKKTGNEWILYKVF